MRRFTVEIADEAWREIESQIRFIAIDRQAPANAATLVEPFAKGHHRPGTDASPAHAR